MKSQRRYDLDWIRVLVFALLIVYHVGMFFVPWQWHIKNNVTADSLKVPMWFLNQWRLPVLFIISGMGTRFALSRRNCKQYITERCHRLVIPLIFGMLSVVAPQVYVERLVDGTTKASFMSFYPHFFEGVYPEGNFSWHHLWFLPYLFTFSILLTPLFIHVRNCPDGGLMRNVRQLFRWRFGILVYLIPLLAVRLTLKPYFPVTHNLIYDWYAFTHYLILFLYGYLFVSSGSQFWERLARIKLPALITGIISFTLMVWMDSARSEGTAGYLLFSLAETLNLGAWAAVIFGYGAVLLNRPGQLLTYCNQAVYPFYIIHQTITVVAGYYILDVEWPIPMKFGFLVIVTFAGSWIFFELVKRFSFTRMAFGIKTQKSERRHNPVPQNHRSILQAEG